MNVKQLLVGLSAKAANDRNLHIYYNNGDNCIIIEYRDLFELKHNKLNSIAAFVQKYDCNFRLFYTAKHGANIAFCLNDCKIIRSKDDKFCSICGRRLEYGRMYISHIRIYDILTDSELNLLNTANNLFANADKKKFKFNISTLTFEKHIAFHHMLKSTENQENYLNICKRINNFQLDFNNNFIKLIALTSFRTYYKYTCKSCDYNDYSSMSYIQHCPNHGVVLDKSLDKKHIDLYLTISFTRFI